MESKLRFLIISLCEGPFASPMLTVARPYTKTISLELHVLTEQEKLLVQEGQISSEIRARPASAIQDAAGKFLPGASTVYATVFHIGLEIDKNLASTTSNPPSNKLDLQNPAEQFRQRVLAFAEPGMDIRTTHIKSSALPDDVFEPGERERIMSSKSKSAKRDRGGTDVSTLSLDPDVVDLYDRSWIPTRKPSA